MAQLSIAPKTAVLTAAAVALHTVPAGQEQRLEMAACNFSTSDATMSLWLVPAGEVRGNKHLRLPDYTIANKEPRGVLPPVHCPPGTVIWVGASAENAIAVSLTGTTKAIA